MSQHCRSQMGGSDECHYEYHYKRKYRTFNYPGAIPGGKTLLTGIRGVNPYKCNKSNKNNKVYICGFYEPPPIQPDQSVKSFVYKGCLHGKGKWYELNFPESEVTNLYGPANNKNGIRKDGISIVGNYTTDESNILIGCLYEGPLDGRGKWTELVPAFDNVKNTIAHSNMGGLVVGNYDTQLDEGKAFIYDIKTKVYHNIAREGAISITAYGIWHNGGDSYTICGGYKPDSIFTSETAYLVDWNSKTHKLSGWKDYHFDNNPIKARITHFDGITGNGKRGYNLTGDWIGNVPDMSELGFFATVKRNKCNKFKDAKWSSVSFPKSNVTSGNSVYQYTVIGVYTVSETETVNGYLSTIK